MIIWQPEPVRKRAMKKYADLQKFKLKVMLLLFIAIVIKYFLGG